MKEFEWYKLAVATGEITVAKACEELGISRQTWYNRQKRGKKKAELVAEVAAENARLQKSQWMEKLEAANAEIERFLNKTFRGLWCNLRFEHVDAAAYWYSFELVNDSRRQTWCVRHSDLEG